MSMTIDETCKELKKLEDKLEKLLDDGLLINSATASKVAAELEEASKKDFEAELKTALADAAKEVRTPAAMKELASASLYSVMAGTTGVSGSLSKLSRTIRQVTKTDKYDMDGLFNFAQERCVEFVYAKDKTIPHLKTITQTLCSNKIQPPSEEYTKALKSVYKLCKDENFWEPNENVVVKKAPADKNYQKTQLANIVKGLTSFQTYWNRDTAGSKAAQLYWKPVSDQLGKTIDSLNKVLAKM